MGANCYLVVGYKSVDYVNRQGRHVVGLELHLSKNDDRVVGTAVRCAYLSDYTGDHPEINDEIRLLFNEWGRPVDFQLV